MTSTEYDKVMMVNLLALVMLSYYRSNNWQCDHCPGGSARLFSKFMDDLVENVGFVCLCTQMWNPTEFQLPPINNKVPRTKTARLFQHCKPSHCVKSNNWPLCPAAEGIKTLLKLNSIQIWNVSIIFCPFSQINRSALDAIFCIGSVNGTQVKGAEKKCLWP